jgi:hypothetical protein
MGNALPKAIVGGREGSSIREVIPPGLLGAALFQHFRTEEGLFKFEILRHLESLSLSDLQKARLSPTPH